MMPLLHFGSMVGEIPLLLAFLVLLCLYTAYATANRPSEWAFWLNSRRMEDLHLLAAPRITTTREARCLADIGAAWVIIGCNRPEDSGRRTWRYTGLLGAAERPHLIAALATGYLSTVTRREPDGSLVLLARLMARPTTATRLQGGAATIGSPTPDGTMGGCSALAGALPWGRTC